ncbi:hypothetical protein Tco_0065376 [Tanacetum coccineum]
MGGMCLHLCCWHCAYCLRKIAAESLLRQRGLVFDLERIGNDLGLENTWKLVIMLNFEGWKLDGYQADGHSCVVLKMVLVGQMDSPPQSPNHVFNFPENEEEFEEDPQEDPEEEMEESQVDEIPHPVTPPRNPTAVPHSSLEQSSESEDSDFANSDEAQVVPPPRAVEELSRNVHYLLRESGSREESKEKSCVKWEDKVEKRRRKDKERLEMTLANVHVMMADRLGWYDMDERSNDAIDVLKTYGITQPPGLQDPSNDP